MNTNNSDNSFTLLSLLGHYAALRLADDDGRSLSAIQNCGLSDQVIDFLAGLGINPTDFDDTVVAVLQTVIEVGVLLERADQRAAANLPQGIDTSVEAWIAAQAAARAAAGIILGDEPLTTDGLGGKRPIPTLTTPDALDTIRGDGKFDRAAASNARSQAASPLNADGRKLVHWYNVADDSETGALASELPDGYYIFNTAPDVNFVMGPWDDATAVLTHLDATSALYPDELIVQVHNSGTEAHRTGNPSALVANSPRTY